MGCFRGSAKPENSTKVEKDQGDVEKQCEGSPVKAAAAPRCSRRTIIMSILVGFAVVAGAATAALWPRDPNWKLTKLDVIDESSLMFFVMAFSNGINNNTELPDLLFHAGASIKNPNLIGGTAMNGEFQVLYQDKLLGGGKSEPVDVPALGSGKVQADIRMKLNPALFKQLTADVLEHSLRATVKVKGGATVKSIFGIELNCRMDCDIQASVSEIFGDTKAAVIENKTCIYHYF